eukprot:1185807-Prorocentrum_minimum.AAC.1
MGSEVISSHWLTGDVQSAVTVWQFDLGSCAFVTMDVRDAVTDQQNELKCVSTIIGNLIGGARLGFEGMHGLMGCSQGHINRVRRCSLDYSVIHCG